MTAAASLSLSASVPNSNRTPVVPTAIASGIRFGKLETLQRCIQTGGAEGMRTLDESIRRLFKGGKISRETAERYVSDPQYLLR